MDAYDLPGATAEIQARRRLGLTATLVREDGREGDVFSLIGPKRFDMPWRLLERDGWIAAAQCREVRVPFPDQDARMAYAVAKPRAREILAARAGGDTWSEIGTRLGLSASGAHRWHRAVGRDIRRRVPRTG